jgi:hypothetical protein
MRFVGRITSTISLVCGLMFGALFGASFLDSVWIESTAVQVLRPQVVERVSTYMNRFEQSNLIEKAREKFPTLNERISRGREKLDASAAQAVDDVAARMLDPSCECRKALSRRYREAFERDASAATQAKVTLAKVETKYGEVAEKLVREWRIFTGVNALAFFGLFFLLLGRKSLGVRVLPVALVVFLGVAVVGYFYLFAQNWLSTILFSSYVGWGYAVWLGAVSLLLSDLLLNKARVSGRILSSIGFDVAPLPC